MRYFLPGSIPGNDSCDRYDKKLHRMEKITLFWEGGREFSLRDTPPCDRLPARSLMLAALGKCSGKTVVAILGKMQVSLLGMRIVVQGNLTEESASGPGIFTEFSVSYDVEAARGDQRIRIERAIALAHDTYCSVTQMFRHIAPVTYDLFVRAPRSSEQTALAAEGVGEKD